MPSTYRRRLELVDNGDVTEVRFLDKKLQDEMIVQSIGEQLYSLIDELGRRKLLVDLANVDYVSSSFLGKLVTVHKKLLALEGQLTLCNLDPQVYAVIESAKLNRLFEIQSTNKSDTKPQSPPTTA